MPTNEHRIKLLEQRIAARKERLENLPTVKKLKTANEADETTLAELTASRDKKRANRQRIDDDHAKTLIGVAVLQLPTPTILRTMRVLRVLLKGRHRDFIEKWFAGRGMDITGRIITEEFSVEEPAATSVNAVTLASPIDPIGMILKKVINKLDEGAFSLVGPEVLRGAEEGDRALLEEWYAKLDQDRQASQKNSESSQGRQASQDAAESYINTP